MGLRGISPRSQGTLGQEGLSSAIALGGLGCRRSYARRGLIPLRCGFGWAPRDQALRSQVSSGKDELSRYARGVVRHGVGPTYLHKRGHSLLFRCRCDGSAGPGASLARKLGGGRVFARCARGVRWIASNARSGLIPLRCGFWGLCRTGPALAGNVGTGGVRHGVGPTYLHKRGHYLLYSCLCDSSAGPGLYSQGTWGQGELSRWRARGNRVFTFRCALRPGPAAAWGSPPLRVLKRGPGRRKRKSRGPCLGSRSDAPRPVLKLPPGIQGRSSRRRAS